MIEIGVMHNGGNDLPVKDTPEGVAVNDGDLAATHRAAQRTLVNQVRQGILADRLGYDVFMMTEHHFQPEGAEFSPNPLLAEAAIASQTQRIRLGQCANIITWHHPIRFAESVAMLDIISNGRVECGIGRGYQPRESEVFGQSYGSTIQDSERNRAFFEEAIDIIIKAWTEESFFYKGDFFTIPPTYTKWNHKQTNAYFSQPGVGRTLDQVLKVGGPDLMAGPNPIQATTTTLRELSVYPQPLQKPYPQLWQPLSSERSVRWAASHGVNAIVIVETGARLKRAVDQYYDQAEKSNWPDRRGDGRPFKYGWDAERRRGFTVARPVHIVEKSLGNLARAGAGSELQWAFYGPFGFTAGLAQPGEPIGDIGRKVTAQELIDKGAALHGSKDHIIEQIIKIQTGGGFVDFNFMAYFDLGGFEGREIEDQMIYFAEEIMPVLRRECGGSPELPKVGFNLSFGSNGERDTAPTKDVILGA
jgi:alkanesulfonate monooxygenase SsuD/methylene tetrahydromethanopterin reductase-like flavin-dependent oxidoreductase (luciferase family)